ncbi:MAG: hypothetical protein LBF60_02305 [Treponema sp.]|jgi:acetyl-CoA carboxylase carboxyl transferase subunit beta|nr:hypothetical protein [Treponema sp.]
MPIKDYIDSNDFYDLSIGNDTKPNKKHTQNAVNINACLIAESKVILIHLDKSFKMGTIGVAEGEKITSAFEYATKWKLPVIAIGASGGIRVNEGTLALMQMAKMSAAVKQHSDKRLLYISVVANPTLGGASAGFVSLADIIIAEKNAIYGFSGIRIIENTTHERLPDDFQTAQYARKHGMVDIVADRFEIKQIISNLLQLHRR